MTVFVAVYAVAFQHGGDIITISRHVSPAQGGHVDKVLWH